MAKIIGTDGSVTALHGLNGPELSLDQLHEAVGGWIEIVRPLPGERRYVLVVNEEGVLKGLPFNPTASVLAGQRIVGPAVWAEYGTEID